MKAYSLDLRTKIVAALARGNATQAQVAEQFGVGLSFLKKMLRQLRTTGNLEQLPHGGGKPVKVDAAKRRSLLARIHAEPDETMEELRVHLANEHGVNVHRTTVGRILADLGWTRKKSDAGE